MFKINKLESTLCNDCEQLMVSMGEYLENYRCVDRCQKLNTSTKAVYVTQLSDALIQMNISRCIEVISKNFIPNLSIDEEISLWGSRMVLSAVIYHEENSLIADIIHWS